MRGVLQEVLWSPGAAQLRDARFSSDGPFFPFSRKRARGYGRFPGRAGAATLSGLRCARGARHLCRSLSDAVSLPNRGAG
ncbi:MAG: hypothetical protein AAB214_20335, partial [Fibrobacterota bacterium]